MKKTNYKKCGINRKTVILYIFLFSFFALNVSAWTGRDGLCYVWNTDFRLTNDSENINLQAGLGYLNASICPHSFIGSSVPGGIVNCSAGFRVYVDMIINDSHSFQTLDGVNSAYTTFLEPKISSPSNISYIGDTNIYWSAYPGLDGVETIIWYHNETTRKNFLIIGKYPTVCGGDYYPDRKNATWMADIGINPVLKLHHSSLYAGGANGAWSWWWGEDNYTSTYDGSTNNTLTPKGAFLRNIYQTDYDGVGTTTTTSTTSTTLPNGYEINSTICIKDKDTNANISNAHVTMSYIDGIYVYGIPIITNEIGYFNFTFYSETLYSLVGYAINYPLRSMWNNLKGSALDIPPNEEGCNLYGYLIAANSTSTTTTTTSTTLPPTYPAYSICISFYEYSKFPDLVLVSEEFNYSISKDGIIYDSGINDFDTKCFNSSYQDVDFNININPLSNYTPHTNPKSLSSGINAIYLDKKTLESSNYYSISGYVTRSDLGTGIGDIDIYFGSYNTFSNGSGFYNISGIPEGTEEQIITNSHGSYIDETFSEFIINSNIIQNISLVPNYNPNDPDEPIPPGKTIKVRVLYKNNYGDLTPLIGAVVKLHSGTTDNREKTVTDSSGIVEFEDCKNNRIYYADASANYFITKRNLMIPSSNYLDIILLPISSEKLCSVTGKVTIKNGTIESNLPNWIVKIFDKDGNLIGDDLTSNENGVYTSGNLDCDKEYIIKSTYGDIDKEIPFKTNSNNPEGISNVPVSFELENVQHTNIISTFIRDIWTVLYLLSLFSFCIVSFIILVPIAIICTFAALILTKTYNEFMKELEKM